jgi:hypothetical protein
MLLDKSFFQDMKDSVGKKEPIEYFRSLTTVFEMLFDCLDKQQNDLNKIKMHSALAINWEPKVAADMLSKQIDILRQDKENYFMELSAMKAAYTEDKVTQNYVDFVEFWTTTMGWHPFLE